MSAGAPAWQIVRCSTANAAADLRATYTWSTWLLGWLVRMLCQVLFFTLVGRSFSGGAHEKFLFLGNSLALCAIEAMTVVVSSAWERRAGTLPLLVAAPADVAWIFVGRSLQWLPSGIATSLAALLALGPFFGVDWTPATALVAALLVASTAVGTYCFGLLLAALVLGASSWRNVASNIAYLSMMAVCGVEVPVDFWPLPVQAVAWVLPLTHGLGALRALVNGGGAASVATGALLCLAVGAAWLVAALSLLRAMVTRGRRDGSITFGI